MASFAYNEFKYSQLGDTGVTPINFKTDTIKLVLLKDTYTPDQDAHNFYDDISAYECAASGSYSLGGVTLSITMSQDNTNNRGVCDAADFSVTTFTGTVRYFALIKSTGVASTSRLIAIYDPGTNIGVYAGTLTVTINSSGLLYIG